MSDKIIMRRAVNWAHRTEGLPRVLKEKNDPLHEVLETTQLSVLLDDPNRPRHDADFYKKATQLMESLSQLHSYDTGQRKYVDIDD